MTFKSNYKFLNKSNASTTYITFNGSTNPFLFIVFSFNKFMGLSSLEYPNRFLYSLINCSSVITYL